MIYFESSLLKCQIGLQWQHFFVDAVEKCHRFSPRQQTGYVAAHTTSHIHIVIFHRKIWLQKVNHFVVYRIFWIILQLQQKRCARHHLVKSERINEIVRCKLTMEHKP